MGNQQRQNKKKKKKKNEQNKQQQQTRDDKSNPFESLSDALTEWKQRLDVIESDETAQKEQEVGDEDADKENDDNIDSEQYAMVPDDVKVDNEEQALMDNDNNEQDQIHNIYNKEDDEDNDMNDNDQFNDDDDDGEEYLH